MSEARVLIAEDEAPLREELHELVVGLWPQCEVVAVCADGREAMGAFDRWQPQACFLDIRMPGATGLDVAEHIGERAHVVFVTAFEEFAIDAFERGAVGYVLKPVQAAKLAAVIERLRARLGERPPELTGLIERLRTELAPRAEPPRLHWITANVGDTLRFFAIEDVIAFVARDKYTQVLTAQDDAVIRTSLKDVARQLDDAEFWQVHRSAIVRASAISRIERDADGHHYVVLKQRAERLPVSAGFRARLRSM